MILKPRGYLLHISQIIWLLFHSECKHLLKPLVWFPLMFRDSSDFSGLSTGCALLQAVVMIRPDPAWFHTASCSDSTLSSFELQHILRLFLLRLRCCGGLPTSFLLPHWTSLRSLANHTNRNFTSLPGIQMRESAVSPTNLSVVRDTEYLWKKLVSNETHCCKVLSDWDVACCLHFTFNSVVTKEDSEGGGEHMIAEYKPPNSKRLFEARTQAAKHLFAKYTEGVFVFYNMVHPKLKISSNFKQNLLYF